MKRNHSIATPDKSGSRAANTAQINYHNAAVEGIGVAEFGGQFEPTVGFQYPDEDDDPAPRVRDDWRNEPVLAKCQRRFPVIHSGHVLTAPLLDKRLEVLQFALRDAVEQMDTDAIYRLAHKARSTAQRVAAEQLAGATPGSREIHAGIVIHDDADRGKVLIQLPRTADAATRRWLKMCGFSGSGDGATYWRRRTFRRGENLALDHARHCVQRIVQKQAIDAGDWRTYITARAISPE